MIELPGKIYYLSTRIISFKSKINLHKFMGEKRCFFWRGDYFYLRIKGWRNTLMPSIRAPLLPMAASACNGQVIINFPAVVGKFSTLLVTNK